MNWEQEKAALKERVDKVAADLSEHFDSVRIFCTKQSEDGKCDTLAIDSGSGNFYAQCGQIREWLSIQDQYQRNWAVRNDKVSEE